MNILFVLVPVISAWDTTTRIHARIRSGDVEEIGIYNGPDDAVSCGFDVSDAIED